MVKELFFETAAMWRTWLETHHDSEKVVWLVFYKVHTGRGGLRYNEALDEALCFGWIDSIIQRLDDDRYRQKFTPRTNTSKWSKVNLARMRRLIAEGRMTDVGLAKVANPSLLAPETPGPAPARGKPAELPVPDFIRDGLAAEPAAQAAFAALPPSRRRLFLGWILDAKRDETRRKRLREAIGLLQAGKTQPMK